MKQKYWVKLALLVTGGLAGALYFENRALNSARQEQRALLERQSESDRVGAANQQFAALRQQAADVDALRAANRDLPKLRNQIRELREQQQEVEAARQANERLASEIDSIAKTPTRITEMEGFLAKASWTYAGFNTPAAAAQNYFRAIRDGSFEEFLGSLSPEAADKMRRVREQLPPPQRGLVMNDFRAFVDSIQGFCMVDEKMESDDKATVSLRFTANGEPLKIELRRYGQGWKVEEP